MLLVEHTRCAEHGELAHIGDAHGHEPSEQTAGKPAGVHQSPEDPSEEAHEHCALSANRRDALTPADGARVSPVPSRDASERPLLAPLHADESGRFRVAPKTSPPA
jgi:hypothetical protein